MTHIKLPHSVIVRAPGLLPMLYTVPEIARLIEVPDRTLRDWLAFQNAPYRKDSSDHIWINGTDFADWVQRLRKSRSKGKEKLADDEAYCLRCKRIVKFHHPIRKYIHGLLVVFQGRCPECGGVINRGGRTQNASDFQER